jgi:hypothetical protein
MDRQRVQYKWKIIAWNALRKDDKDFEQKTRTLNESQWFDNKKVCIKNFKEVIRNGCDIVDSWGTAEYLFKRKITQK